MLAAYVDAWSESVEDFVALLEELEPEDWSKQTDLPGWDVKAVASHVAHLESLLAGGPHEKADVPELAHVTSPMGQFTEIGVINRRESEPAAIIAELRASVEQRRADLAAEPPADGSPTAPGVFGAIGWTVATLLRNRPLDVWMHEQDIRRATERPGGMESLGAQHTANYLSEGFGFVVAKKVGAPAGTTAVLEVTGCEPVAVSIDDNGRGQRLPVTPEQPSVVVEMDRETFTLLAGGRRVVASDAVGIAGDQDLGRQIVDNLATTP